MDKKYVNGITIYAYVLNGFAFITGNISFNSTGVNIESIVSGLPIENTPRHVTKFPITTYAGGVEGQGILSFYSNKFGMICSGVALKTEYAFNFTAKLK